MAKVRVESFAISLDGYGAGPDQDIKNGLGVGGEKLHDWFIPTNTFQRVQRGGTGTTGVDDHFAARGFQNIGAWILGRNMFGPIRGPWPELHIAIAPILLGRGERLFERVDLRMLGYECVGFAASEKATHVVLRRPKQ